LLYFNLSHYIKSAAGTAFTRVLPAATGDGDGEQKVGEDNDGGFKRVKGGKRWGRAS